MPDFTVLNIKRRFLIFSVLVSVMMFFGFLVGKPFHLGDEMSVVKPSVTGVLEHNSGVALLLMFGGMLTWGICSYAVLSINSLIAGFIAANLSFFQFITVLCPYVFFELLAYILFAIIGVCLADNLKQSVKNSRKELLLNNEKELKTLLAFGLIVLAIGAAVEGMV